MSAARYPSLVAFYADSVDRLVSEERDVGLWWRDAEEGPIHRAAWIEDTGELYLTCCTDPEHGGGRVEVLAVVAEQEDLDAGVAGWRDVCGEAGSLAWLRERAATLVGRADRVGHDV